MKSADLIALLEERVVVCDGGMGTELYAKGVFINQCYDELNLSRPALVMDVHKAFSDAGAQILETNTFSANRYRLEPYGLAEELTAINRRGAELAREVAGPGILVAGAVGPLGIRIEPWGPTSVDEAEQAFREQVRALLQGGVDLFILETFSDLNEIKQAIKAVQAEAPGMAIVAQMTVGNDGSGLYGTSTETFAERLAQWGADVIGLNCSVGPETMLTAIERMAAVAQRKLSAQPNAGTPRNVDGRNFYMATPEYMAEYAKRFIQAGVRLIGGCCGVNPRHIKAMAAAVRALTPGRVLARVRAQASSAEGNVEANAEAPGRGSAQPPAPVPMRDKSAFARKLSEGKFVVSMELTPPRGTVAVAQVDAARLAKSWGVDAVNIPDGPRASARMSPLALAVLLEREAGMETVLHYCCRDRNILGMQSDLLGASALGLHNLLLITGDPPKLGDYPDATAVFDIDAIGLTNVVHRLNQGFDIGENPIGKPTGFLIGVGANPGAIDLATELKRFRFKVEAGAEFAITQPVFDVELLTAFLEKIQDHRIPVLAGIWPLASFRNAEFMNNEVPGAKVPARYLERMSRCTTKEAGRAEGLAIAQEMLEQVKPLVQGVQISVPFGRAKPLEDLVAAARRGA